MFNPNIRDIKYCGNAHMVLCVIPQTPDPEKEQYRNETAPQENPRKRGRESRTNMRTMTETCISRPHPFYLCGGIMYLFKNSCRLPFPGRDCVGIDCKGSSTIGVDDVNDYDSMTI